MLIGVCHHSCWILSSSGYHGDYHGVAGCCDGTCDVHHNDVASIGVHHPGLGVGCTGLIGVHHGDIDVVNGGSPILGAAGHTGLFGVVDITCDHGLVGDFGIFYMLEEKVCYGYIAVGDW